MKILFVSHHSNLVGGGELSQLQLLQSLHAKGGDMMLAVPDVGWCEQQAKAYDIPVVHLPMPQISGLAVFVALWQWVKTIVAIKDLDVIHANTSRSCFYAGLVGRILSIPVIFHCRIADRDPKLDWVLAHLVQCIVANSDATAQRFVQWKSLDVRTVYNGIDVTQGNAKQVRPFGAGLVLLCVARVSRWKRHDLVLDAFESLAEPFDELHLVNVGGEDPFEPDWWNALQRRSQKSKVSERIHWVGEQEDMDPWYGGADILFLASEREPFGRVIVEAMGHGLPVVAFNQGGPSEIVTDGIQGLLLNEEDDLGEKIKPLLECESLRIEMGRAGFKRVKHFSLSNHVSSMCHVFESVRRDR